jgi:hypothetical protein
MLIILEVEASTMEVVRMLSNQFEYLQEEVAALTSNNEGMKH